MLFVEFSIFLNSKSPIPIKYQRIVGTMEKPVVKIESSKKPALQFR